MFAGGFAAFSAYVASLQPPRDLAPADAIIVLTGGQARLDAAVDLLRAGKGRRLLVSGAHPSVGWDALREATGGDRKLFSCCVDIDHAALNTVGNAEQSAAWVDAHEFRSVILVTNNYHMPRSLLEMSRLIGEEAEVTPYPVVNTPLSLSRAVSEPDALRVLATEYAKFLAALARGALPGAADAGGEWRLVEATDLAAPPPR
ncbi:MAG TPA: YdcF family protein [Mesorhizobium sp.]|nr:YdcF family protein [Mesorhizobium sp.]